MTFGEKLIFKREAKGYSRKKLADMTGIPPSTIKNYEEGVSDPRLSVLLILADTLDFSIDAMFERVKYAVHKK